MRRFVIFAALLGACTYEWDENTALYPLTGTEPSLNGFDHLNTVPAGRASLLTGTDGKPWVAFCEYWASGSGTNAAACKRMHLHELGGGSGDEVILADGFALHVTELYELRNGASDTAPGTITLHRPGDPITTDETFTVPGGPHVIATNDNGDPDVFVYWAGQDLFGVYRRDRAQRQIPVPSGVDPSKPNSTSGLQFKFSLDGDTLVVRGPDGTLTAYATDGQATTVLAAKATQGYFAIDDPRSAVLVRTDSALVSSPLDGSVAKTIVPAAIDPTTIVIEGSEAFFDLNDDLRVVLLDGSAASTVVASPAARLLSYGPRAQLVYSTDPATEYASGAGNGFIGVTQVMQRGRVIRWSADGVTLRYLENAATLGTYGDLTSIVTPSGTPSTLAINTHAFAELPDHRVLAVEDAVYRGAWNRLVVIDEQAGTKEWVVPSTAEFSLTPDGTEIIADVVSGASGYDIVRVPVSR